MELIVDRTVLLGELSLLQGVVEKKNTLPVLAHLLLRVKAGEHGPHVEMAATDLEIGLLTSFEAQCLSQGGITVSAKKLFEIVRSLPEADVHLRSTDGKQLEITCGRSNYTVMGLPEADFPSIPEPVSKEELSLPKELLLTLVARTSFAITADETRFAVAGGLLVVNAGKVAIVATDGHRLAYAIGALAEAGPLTQLRVLLPRKTLLELRKLTESGDDVVRLSKDEKHVFFRTGARTMISRILEGTFPQYEKVIPLGHPRHFVLDRAELLAAVRRVAILSSDRTHAVRMAFKSDRIELEAESPELGQAHEDLPYQYDGQEFQVSFNAHYVIDFLGAVGTEKIEMRLKDAETQALLLPFVEAGRKVEDSDYRYVIMPMRT